MPQMAPMSWISLYLFFKKSTVKIPKFMNKYLFSKW